LAVFFTKTLPLFMAALMLALTLPISNAALLEVYDEVGTDPTGDAVFPLATGVNYPSCGTGFGCGKYDVTSLEMANDGDNLQIKVNVAASYAGTTMILYAVHFKAAGTSYFTCWTVQSAGTTTASNDVNENSLGCSRFLGETQVGPATRAAGVQAATDAQGRYFVRWEIPKTAIKEPTELTDIYVDVWSRGVSTCCAANAGSSQSQQMWNVADRAPNTGTWAYSLAPKAPALSLNLSIEPNATAVAPGTAAQFAANVSLVGDGLAEVNFTLQGLPEGWTFAGLESNISLGGDNQSVLVNFTVTPPADASNQTVNLTLNATSLAAGVASVNFTLAADPSLLPPAPVATATASTPSPVGTAATAPTTESDKIPGPGALLLLAALAGTVVAVRRRGDRQ
jgi:hypothetical protein